MASPASSAAPPTVPASSAMPAALADPADQPRGVHVDSHLRWPRDSEGYRRAAVGSAIPDTAIL